MVMDIPDCYGHTKWLWTYWIVMVILNDYGHTKWLWTYWLVIVILNDYGHIKNLDIPRHGLCTFI